MEIEILDYLSRIRPRGLINGWTAMFLAGCCLFWFGYQMISDLRATIQEAEVDQSIWGKFFNRLNPSFRGPLLITFSIIYILLGSILVYIPAATFGFVPSISLGSAFSNNDDYFEFIEYEESIVKQLTEKNPGYYVTYDYDYEGLLIVNASSKDYFIYDLSRRFDDGKSEDEIIAELDGKFEKYIKEFKNDPKLSDYYQEIKTEVMDYYQFELAETAVKAKEHHALNPVETDNSSNSTQQTNNNQEVPSLETANQLLGQASRAWNAGNKQASLEYAKQAYDIKLHHLGSNHADVIEIQRMIQAAQ